MSIGDRIKELRGDENQSSFGERFGKGRNTIVRYESEKNPPDAEFLEAICREYKVSPTWLLLGEGEKELKTHEIDDHVDMMKDVLFADPEAARRRQAKTGEIGQMMRSARQIFEDIAKQHKLDNLPEPATEREESLVSAIDSMRELFKAEIFGRISAEHKAEEYATKQAAEKVTDTVNVQELLNMTAEVLVSNTLYRPALAANIKAFHRSIALEQDNRKLMERMEKIEQKMATMDNILAEHNRLTRENAELRASMESTMSLLLNPHPEEKKEGLRKAIIAARDKVIEGPKKEPKEKS